ncbi:MAG: hypothetical protein DRN90_03890 [Thermoproteota archaeon]|nr:MAG: hypothetical protein DRN90_03890 [Candidatus Korarchaeota archaeon]
MWGDGRWLIAGRHRSSFTSYDGDKFEDLMQELNKAIELRGGGPEDQDLPYGMSNFWLFYCFLWR